jgi:phage FluMu protein Com
MSDDVFRCTHCHAKVRSRTGRVPSRFRCPRCQTLNEIVSGDPQPATTQPEALPIVACAVTAVEPDTRATIESVVAAAPAPVPAPFAPQPAVMVRSSFVPVETILSNGLAQGLIAAGILYLVVPELGWELSRSRLIVVLAFIVLAGALGLFGGIFRLGWSLLRPATAPTATILGQEVRPPSLAAGMRPALADNRDPSHPAGGVGLPPVRASRRDVVPATLVTVVATSVGEPEPNATALKGGPIAHPVLKGLLCGLVACLVLSALKPTIGIKGLAYTFAGILVALILLLATLVRLHLALVARSDPRSPAPTRLRLTAIRLLKAGAVTLALSGLLVVAETLAPDEGLLKTTVKAQRDAAKERETKDKAEHDDAVKAQVAKAKADEEQKWSEASFLLTSPNGYAVAIHRDGEEPSALYKVVAKGRETEAQTGQQIAWESKNPIVANDPALAVRIYQSVDIGKTLPDPLADDVRELWRPKEFLPGSERLVSFEDVTLHRRRTGFAVENVGGVLSYCDLIPMRARTPAIGKMATEPAFQLERIVLSERTRPGSIRENLSAVELRERSDFLEWCVFNVLQTLQKTQTTLQKNQSRPVDLLVDGVVADVDGSEVKKHETEGGLGSKRKDQSDAQDRLDRELRSANQSVNGPVRFLGMLLEKLDHTEQRQRLEDYRESTRIELQKEVAALKAEIAQVRLLIDHENRLSGEIRSLLNRVGITMVERSDRAREVLLSKVNGQTWLRPDPKEAIQSKLVVASHLLLTEIRKPERTGMYQLSMRLIDVASGTILWEDQGDRTPTGDPGLKRGVTAVRDESDSKAGGFAEPVSRWPTTVRFDGMISPRRAKRIAVSLMFTKLDAGTLKTSVDSPADRRFGLPSEQVTLSGPRLSFNVPAFGARFAGAISDDGSRIDGTWTMKGETAPITLTRH